MLPFVKQIYQSDKSQLPVIEKATHSATLTAWSAILSRYFAIITISRASEPSSLFL